jgi:RNA polymerase sigma-70 factor, ECF subfamily
LAKVNRWPYPARSAILVGVRQHSEALASFHFREAAVRSCRAGSLPVYTTMPLDHETILRHLFAARQRLSAAAWLIVRDAHGAEDIFQNVALKSVTRGVSFEHEGALLSWATVSAKREAIDWLRKRKSESLGLEPDVLDLLDSEWQSKSAAPEGARMNALKECIDSVPVNSRRLLELRYFEGRPCQEIAKTLDLGAEAIYQRLSRLHRQLKQCVEKRLLPS